MRQSCSILTVIAAAVLLGAPPTMESAVAQEPAKGLKRPPEWQVRFDRAAAHDSSLYFVAMPPGWHITTGPAGILYDPAKTAGGEYRTRSEIFLFPGNQLEGFGVFVGGQHLTGDDQAYTYFLLRKDGKFLVKQRRGAETEELVPWTDAAAVVRHEGGEGTAKNVIEIAVGLDSVDFLVNGERVATLPRSQVDTEGVVGLRINHGLNLHVTDLTVLPRP